MSEELFSRNRLAGHTAEAMRSIDALVIGAGALAQNVLVTLGPEGPGRIRIVDRDTWSSHNATRSPLYGDPATRASCGNHKAATVATELRRMTAWNPELRIEHACCWVQELGDAPFREASVVVSCVDDPVARAYIAAMCHRHGKPMIEGGLSGSAGSFAVYDDPAGPCWQCGVPAPTGVRVPAGCEANAIEQARQGYIPMTQPIAAALGACMAEATIVLAHGPSGLSGKRVYLDDIRAPAMATIAEARSRSCACPHETLDRPEIQIEATEETPAGEVLGRLSERIDQPRVWLRAPFIGREVCPGPLGDATQGCGAVIDVAACEWSLKRHPRCVACGGEFEKSTDPNLAVLNELTGSDAAWLDLPMSRWGFASGDWLEVEGGSGRVEVIGLSDGPGRFQPVPLPPAA